MTRDGHRTRVSSLTSCVLDLESRPVRAHHTSSLKIVFTRDKWFQPRLTLGV